LPSKGGKEAIRIEAIYTLQEASMMWQAKNIKDLWNYKITLQKGKMVKQPVNLLYIIISRRIILFLMLISTRGDFVQKKKVREEICQKKLREEFFFF